MNSTKNPLHLWFMHLFEKRMDRKGFVRCFECDRPMHEDVYKEISACYSHLLSKKTHPEHAGNPDNVVIVHPDCHNLYERLPQKAKKQYARYLELKNKYYEE
jgi:5-methylcytosine-specific restriction endonuclease McrA